jgi:hypothetical protein
MSDGSQQTANFGHHVKGDQETGEKGAHSRFSIDRLFLIFDAYLNIVCIKSVEDLKIRFKAFADVGLDNGRVEGEFLSADAHVKIAIAIGNANETMFLVH